MLYLPEQYIVKNLMCQPQEAHQCVRHLRVVSTHSKRRGKEGASEGASLKQVSLRSTRIDGFIIVFTKIFAVSPNKNSMLMKSEEHAGMHPKHHLPLQVCILQPILAARWCRSFTPHTSLPQVAVRKHVEHPAQLENSTEAGKRQQLPAELHSGNLLYGFVFLNIRATK